MTPSLQRDLLLTVIGVILAFGIPLAVYRHTAHKPTLTQTEQILAGFTPASFEVSRRTWQQTTLSPPLHPVAAPTGTTAALTPAVPRTVPPPSPPPVSFILHDGAASRAIVGGMIVTQGSVVQGWTVERIERTRILLRNRKGTTWLKLD